MVEPSHRLAASLMATNVPHDASALDISMPWSCFAFYVPAGLISDATRLAFVVKRSSDVIGMLSFGTFLHLGAEPSLTSWAQHERVNDIGDFTAEETQRSDRETLMFGRLLVGICAEMGTHRPSKEHATRNSGPKKTSQARQFTTFKLSRDVRVDVRKAVRDYVEGRTNRGPTVQILVRGHWKSQVHGPERSQRKMIHVEPYWRGPEDAPVAVRVHRIDERPS
jgi:hypothetical protein